MSILKGRSRRPSVFQKIGAIDFNAPHIARRCLIFMPLFCGVWSLLLGQDANYDLYNYHLYNAFAFLNDKLSTDLAPASSQSYFNPSLDLAYYLMITHIPPRLAGFIMGCLHGLNFVLIYGVARKTLPFLPAEDRYRIPLFLAGAGCVTGNFFSEMGNNMGDNTTAMFSVGALLLILACWERLGRWSWQSIALIMAAGLIAGIGIGLKLTNAVFALALCAALLWYPAKFRMRAGLAFFFGLAVLLGLALSGGYWFWTMWQEFRNPLFPQFSAFFPNDLTSSVIVGDARWRPKNLLETVFWPVILTIFPGRVGEGRMHQFIWALVYLQLICTGIKWLYDKRMAITQPRLDVRTRFLLAYFILAFICWMEVFSIYRYIIAIELLAPLVMYILFTRLMPRAPAWKWSSRAIKVSFFMVLLAGSSTWGHEGWADRPFHAELPVLENPAKMLVILPGGEPPLGWMPILFPKEVAFALLNAYPAGPGYAIRFNEMMAERSDAMYTLFDARYDSRPESVAKADAIIARLGLNGGQSGCDALRWVTEKFRLGTEVAPSVTGAAQCQLRVRPEYVVDIEAENRAIRDERRERFTSNRLKVIDESCRNFNAWMGNGLKPRQLCKLERM